MSSRLRFRFQIKYTCLRNF